MLLTLKIVALIAVLALGGCASSGQSLSGDQNQTRYELKDGSILVVDADGRMRMFNLHGEPLYMKDGVAMELEDGAIITMKEDVIRKELRTRSTLKFRS